MIKRKTSQGYQINHAKAQGHASYILWEGHSLNSSASKSIGLFQKNVKFPKNSCSNIILHSMEQTSHTCTLLRHLRGLTY